MADRFIRLFIDSRGAKKGADETTKALDTVSKGAASVDKSLDRIPSKFTLIGNAARQLSGVLGGLGAGFAGFAALTSTVKTVGDFNKVLAELATVAGSDRLSATFQKQTAAIQQFGAATQFGATEVAKAALGYVKAGLSIEDALKALPAAFNLAVAGGLDVAAAVDQIVNASTQLKVPIDEAGRVADVLVKTANLATTDVRELAEAFKYAGPAAGTLGISIEELSAVLGALAQGGIKASSAGTNFLGIALDALKDPTDKAKEAIASFGLTIDDLVPRAGKVADVFVKLREARERVGTEEFVKGLSAIYGAVNVNAVASLTDQADTVRNFFGELQNAAGESQKIADALGGELPAKFKELGAAFEGLKLSLGRGAFGDAIGGSVGFVTNLVREFAGVSTEGNKAGTAVHAVAEGLRVAAASATAFAAATAVGGLVTMARNATAAKTAIDAATGAIIVQSKATSLLALGWGGVQKAATAALTFITTHPIVAAITAATAALVLFRDVEVSIGDESATVGDITVGAFQYIGDKVTAIASWIGDGFSFVWDKIKQGAEAVGGFLRDLFNDIGELFGLDGAGDAAAEAGQAIAAGVADGFAAGADAIKNVAEPVVDDVLKRAVERAKARRAATADPGAGLPGSAGAGAAAADAAAQAAALAAAAEEAAKLATGLNTAAAASANLAKSGAFDELTQDLEARRSLIGLTEQQVAVEQGVAQARKAALEQFGEGSADGAAAVEQYRARLESVLELERLAAEATEERARAAEDAARAAEKEAEARQAAADALATRRDGLRDRASSAGLTQAQREAREGEAAVRADAAIRYGGNAESIEREVAAYRELLATAQQAEGAAKLADLQKQSGDELAQRRALIGLTEEQATIERQVAEFRKQASEALPNDAAKVEAVTAAYREQVTEVERLEHAAAKAKEQAEGIGNAIANPVGGALDDAFGKALDGEKFDPKAILGGLGKDITKNLFSELVSKPLTENLKTSISTGLLGQGGQAGASPAGGILGGLFGGGATANTGTTPAAAATAAALGQPGGAANAIGAALGAGAGTGVMNVTAQVVNITGGLGGAAGAAGGGIGGPGGLVSGLFGGAGDLITGAGAGVGGLLGGAGNLIGGIPGLGGVGSLLGGLGGGVSGLTGLLGGGVGGLGGLLGGGLNSLLGMGGGAAGGAGGLLGGLLGGGGAGAGGLLSGIGGLLGGAGGAAGGALGGIGSLLGPLLGSVIPGVGGLLGGLLGGGAGGGGLLGGLLGGGGTGGLGSLLGTVAGFAIPGIGPILGPLLGGLFGDGGIIGHGGHVVPFARGGTRNGYVTSGPEFFPLAGNKVGARGEAGPEAILPLHPLGNGQLGVNAVTDGGGRGDVYVTHNNRYYTPDSDSFRESQQHRIADDRRMAKRLYPQGER